MHWSSCGEDNHLPTVESEGSLLSLHGHTLEKRWEKMLKSEKKKKDALQW